MKPKAATTMYGAMVRRGHPRLDYRTEEAKAFAAGYVTLLRNHIRHGMRALDLGCCCGKTTFALEEAGAQAFGNDSSTM